ncbi:hypothetical protein [Micromonospora sp. RTP1Z1]|uniref:hypothetical protein n=1 Tax=Micromonospora sp. RTP1Z1 TaxID=2994043 RepID=UPI0029C753BE|nr:hypothetical protein [Micromonospora sp. RTP1Z1]
MAVDIPALTGDTLGPGFPADNPARVAAVAATAARLDDAVPVLLVPVRLETRFDQIRVPSSAGLTPAEQFTVALTAVADALAALAASNLATRLPTGGPARTQYKRDTEDPLITGVDKLLDRADAARATAAAAIRDLPPAPPDAAQRERIRVAAGRITDLLGKARTALAGVRSAYHRDRLTARLDRLAAAAKPVLAAAGGVQRPPGPDRLRDTLEDATRAATALDLPGQDHLQRYEALLAAADPLLAAVRDAALLAADLPGVPPDEAADLRGRAQRLRAAVDTATGPVRALLDQTGPQVRPVTERAQMLHDEAARLADTLDRLPTGAGTGPATLAAPAAATRTVDVLRVRIFPDDVSVLTHERDLTAAERAAGAAYWAAGTAGGGDDTAYRAAWRALVAKHGPRRAAWVARQTRPDDHTPPPPEVSEALRALRVLDRRIEEVASREGRRPDSLARAVADAATAVRALTALPPAVAARIRDAAASASLRLAGLGQPDHFTDLPATVDALAAHTAALPPDPAPTPAAVTAPAGQPPPAKSGTWTQPPRAGLMPTRFLVVTVTGDRVSHAVCGNPVPGDLALGLDPGDAHPDRTMRWLVDYADAEANGMAITVPITAHEAATGFDRVYALGLATPDPTANAGRLADAVEDHHYTGAGLSLLPVGSPTNSTDAAESVFSSSTDPDATFAIEQGPPLIADPTPASEPAPDGWLLARALGLPADVFAHVEHADGTDIADALTATTALWPATLGYAAEELLGELIGLDGQDLLRAFGTAHVLARGTLPSLRVSHQPYGVLATSAFSRWTPDGGDTLPAGPGLTDEQAQQRFRVLLRDTLAIMNADWTRHRQAHVHHADGTPAANPQQQVIELLGLDSTAVGYAQRFSVNAGRKGGGFGWSTLHVGLPGKTPDPQDAAGAYALMERFAPVLRDAFGLGGGPLLDKGAVAAAFVDTYERISSSRGYEVRYLDTDVPLHGPVAPDAGIPAIAGMLAATPEDLARQAVDGTPAPLLILLLRHALLVQARDTALRIAAREGMATAELRARIGSGDLFRITTLAGDIRVSRWSYLLARLSRLNGLLGLRFPAAPGSLYAYLTRGGPEHRLHEYVAHRGDNPLFTGFAGSARHTDLMAAARDHAAAVQRLGELPTDRLDQLTREHLDVCSHRLDAWILGLADERLAAMRVAHPTGVHLGAFGWVEALAPKPRQRATGVPAALAGGGPAYLQAGNEGFVHAPSVTHAVTAAVLRAGYVAQGEDPAGEARARMSVNLSSRRVRTALAVLDGITAGNDVGSLLGYQLERDLHEAGEFDGVELDALIAPLRSAFPSVVPVDPAAAAVPTAERLVVDGLRLLTAVRDWVRLHGGATTGRLLDALRGGGYALYPFGVVAADGTVLLPPRTDPTRLDPVLEAIDRLADTIDAVGDLVTVEGVHQIVQGNHPRAAAALSAFGQARAPARPEVVDTPAEGLRVTHRLLLHLARVDARGLSPQTVPDAGARDAARRAALPAGWTDAAMTARAAAEPTLNRWLGELLGPAGMTRVAVVDEAGDHVADVSLRSLQVQPLDLLAAMHEGFEAALTELSARLVDTLRPIDVRDGEPAPALSISLDRRPDWPADVRSLPETAALLEAVTTLATGWRAAEPSDYLLAETAAAAAGAGGVDADELALRATDAVDSLIALGLRLAALISDGADGTDPAVLAGDPLAYLAAHRDTYRGATAAPPADGPAPPMARLRDWWARRDDARRAVLDAAGYGVKITPVTRWTTRDQVGRELLDTVEAAYLDVARRLAAAVPKVTAAQATAAGSTAAARAWGEVLQVVFGSGFPAMPHLTISNEDEIAAGLAAPPVRADPLAVERWLAGAATVRDGAQALSTTLALADAFAEQPFTGQPLDTAVVQLPARAGEVWAGASWAADAGGGPAPDGDRISLVLLRPADRPTGGTPALAILLDGWLEMIPAGSTTTAVALHYDQPDARAPQSLLLAVPPARRGAWRLEDLVQTLHDTLELAKNRAVEPEHLRDDVYGQLLPALIGDIAPYGPGGGLVDHRVVLDFALMQPAEKP